MNNAPRKVPLCDLDIGNNTTMISDISVKIKRDIVDNIVDLTMALPTTTSTTKTRRNSTAAAAASQNQESGEGPARALRKRKVEEEPLQTTKSGRVSSKKKK
jgi:hypothetical protein